MGVTIQFIWGLCSGKYINLITYNQGELPSVKHDKDKFQVVAVEVDRNEKVRHIICLTE